MATKTKTIEVSVAPVEKTFTEALELFNAGNIEASATALALVVTEATALERLNLVHSAKAYLMAIQARRDAQQAEAPQTPELAAQLLLNEQEPAQALAVIEKALAADPDRAVLHYLNAVACAQLDEVQASADALAKAVALDPDVLFQFRLESDFDGLRQQAPFAVLLRG